MTDQWSDDSEKWVGQLGRDNKSLAQVNLRVRELEAIADRAEARRIAESGADVSAAVFMQGIELCKKIAGSNWLHANHSEFLVVDGWHERISVFYYGGNEMKHFQLITLWGGERGENREAVFTREKRDDQAKTVLRASLLERLEKRRDQALLGEVSNDDNQLTEVA